MKGFFALPVLLRLAIAETLPYFQSSEFDSGKFGPYPNRTFVSRPDLVAPSLNIVKKNEACNDGLYTLISLRGDKVDTQRGGQSPMILDGQGNLVWMNATYGETYDLAIQNFDGEEYITFWQGQGRKQGHSTGEYVMLDSHYREIYRSPPGDGTAGDLHEFRLTSEGTALSTQYILKKVDVHRGTITYKASIWDSRIQEFDIKTNKVIFEWNASEHFDVSESYSAGLNSGFTVGDGYDFFHINSIDKNAEGNYLISSRYYSMLVYIDGKTGEVLWQLGGKHNNFQDLSDGEATNFAFQHHARWNEDHTGVHIFDNGARYGQKPVRDNSRGLHILLDLEAMTAELKQEYTNPQKLVSISQGSMQILPSGNVLMGYGYNAAWTEYSQDGEVLCDVHVGSQSTFNTGAVQTYRVRKHSWMGNPVYPPTIKYENEEIFVSWNGATEVAAWGVSVSTEATGVFEQISTTEKDGFETSMSFDNGIYCYVKALALDHQGEVIGTSNTIDACSGNVQDDELSENIEAEAEAENKDTSSSNVFVQGLGDDEQDDLAFSLDKGWIFWMLVTSGIVVGIFVVGCLVWRHFQDRKYMALYQSEEEEEAGYADAEVSLSLVPSSLNFRLIQETSFAREIPPHSEDAERGISGICKVDSFEDCTPW